LEKKNCRDVVDRDGSKNGFNVGKPSCMIEFIGLDSSKLGSKFVDDELIGFIPISMAEDHGMAKVKSIRKQIRHRKDSLNLGFGKIVNILAEEDG